MTHNKENIPGNSQEIHIRVDNDNEILGKMPAWIIRYGMILTGAILVLLFIVFIFFKIPDNLIVPGNFYSTEELAKSSILDDLSIKTMQESIINKGSYADTCFLGDFSQQQARLLKAGQYAGIKYAGSDEVFSKRKIMLKKIIFDTINKKTIILFNQVIVGNRSQLSGLEIEITQKSIFQILFN